MPGRRSFAVLRMTERGIGVEIAKVLEDHPGLKLVSGQVGTIVDSLGSEMFEVEFLDGEGRSGRLAWWSWDERIFSSCATSRRSWRE